MLGFICIALVYSAIAIGIGTSLVVRRTRGSFTAKRTLRDGAGGIVLGFTVGALAELVGGFPPVIDVYVGCVVGLATVVVSCFDPTP
jgi:hypothetical protein